jgi:voltage-gated potassium channel Kch
VATQAASPKISQLKLRTTSHRFALLLCSQFALIAISPLTDTSGRRPGPVFTALAMALFLTALNLIVEKRRHRAVAFLLCAAAVLTGLLSSLGFERVFLIPGLVCAIIFMLFTTAMILRAVITATKVTNETLYGAVSAYLFIGITCGMSYALIELLAPGSVVKTANSGRPLAWSDFAFFSFITLTTVGYGDIVPVGAARALAMIEAVTGAMYPAILIGRLLTLLPGRELQD